VTPTLRVAGAQTHNRVGDLAGNARQIRATMAWAEEQGADVLLLPEMGLTGYPIEDLAFRRQFVADARTALLRLARESRGVVTLVGTTDIVDPQRTWDTRERQVANAQAVLWGGELRGVYHKVLLPTYDVFDEARTFAAGRQAGAVWRIGPALAGICICEDLWSDGEGPPEAQAAAGAQILLVANGSPFYRGKPAVRRERIAAVTARTSLPVVYVNCVGGHDDLVFDGGSFAVDAKGREIATAAQFADERFVVDVPLAPPLPGPAAAPARTVHARRDHDARPAVASPPPVPPLDELDQVWAGIRVGLADFVGANGFDGAAVALSGGVDSTVTLLAAREALGASSVLAVAMPADEHHAAELADARTLAERAGIELLVHDLSGVIELVASHLPELDDPSQRARLELEARARAMVLTTLAAERRLLPLATINKTELAIGASSLAGETAGGFAPLKDCPKQLVYELARRQDERHGLIPARTLERRATLRTRAGVELPPYEVLDAIVEMYVSGEEDLAEIVAAGFDPELVRGVLQLVDDAEFKRRLSPLGTKISQRAFGQDLRMPVSSRWRPYQLEEEALVPGAEEAAPWEAGEALTG
jgi:NAD+ synthase (glutamine-hydrolysing)